MFQRVLHAAEAAVIDAGQIAEVHLGDASALAAPLGTEEGNQLIGIVSVVRGDRQFTDGERELLRVSPTRRRSRSRMSTCTKPSSARP